MQETMHGGMLHAVCATRDDASGCDEAGRELWAFLPRTQLYRVRRNDLEVQASEGSAGSTEPGSQHKRKVWLRLR